MPELPEITVLAQQMQANLVGRVISDMTVLQPKCLNVSPEEFQTALVNAEILAVSHKGKWLFTETSQGWLLLNLGMGGEILLVTSDSLPEKHRLVINFSDGDCLAINFWWFGYAHFAPPTDLASHEMTAKLGPNALDLTADDLRAMFAGRRGRVKTFLLDQSKIAGIGNAYIHDILFLAKLHPLRPINTLTDADIDALAIAIQRGLEPSITKGGSFYEQDLFGQKGNFQREDIIIGYRENEPCPVCQTPIEKLKTGSTSGFICPTCQLLEP